MISRTLVLHHEGAPLLASITAAAIRRRIVDYPDDDADLFRVWEVPNDESYALAQDITERFALDWAGEIINDHGFGNGIDRAEVLAPFPAFIREIVGGKLLARWQAEVIAALPITPNPLKRRAA